MGRSRSARRGPLLAVVVALVLSLLGGFAPVAGASAVAAPRVLTGTIGGAEYRIQVPENWNGTLMLYSHGYVAPGQPNPAVDVPDPIAAEVLLGQGFAIAGSSYSGTGWVVEQAIGDQIALLDRFVAEVGQPTRTIAWGHSLGGIITAGLAQRYPQRFAGALPFCGVLQGGVAAWNLSLDRAFAFKYLFAANDPSLAITNIANPDGNALRALALLKEAQATPQGRAKLALVGAISQTVDWYDPGSAAPAPGDFATRAANQAAWFTSPDFYFDFMFRADLEARMGGNPSFNVGVSYRDLFNRSGQRDLAEALYRDAGLNLDADLQAIENAPRIAHNQQALDNLRRGIDFDGNLAVPTLTMHTVADGLVPVEAEAAYADVVRAAGKQDLLRQLYVNRAGHCAFTPAEQLVALQQLIARIETGRWNDGALTPTALNNAATALGARLNGLPIGSGVAPATASFTTYQPRPILRPFDTRSQPPAIPSQPSPAPSSPPAPQPSPSPGAPLPGLPNTGGGGEARSGTGLLIVIAAGAAGVGLAAVRRRRRAA